jgi:RNA polymerase sigma-70 factor (ECF subfamily)
LAAVLEDRIAAFAEEAHRGVQRTWPAIRTPASAFVDYVRTKLPQQDAEAALDELHGTDLFLAFGCLHGDREAWRAFDRAYLAKVPDYVARVDRSPAFADEVRQRIAEKLAGTGEGPGRLAQYSGRGALSAWVRVAALREAHTIARSRKRSVDFEEVSLRAPDVDPELALLKRRSAEVFRKAFAEVVASLDADERTLLRLHYLDGLTIEDVGKASKVSRASAARLLAQTRERIMNRVERALRNDLGAQAPGARSLLDLVRSQLDLSIARQFRGDSEEP